MAWGTLSWLYMPDGPSGVIHSMKFIPGWVGGRDHGIVAELFVRPSPPIARIVLECRDKRVDLDDIVVALMDFVDELDVALALAYPDKPDLNRDKAVRTEAWVVGEPGAPDPAKRPKPD